MPPPLPLPQLLDHLQILARLDQPRLLPGHTSPRRFKVAMRVRELPMKPASMKLPCPQGGHVQRRRVTTHAPLLGETVYFVEIIRDATFNELLRTQRLGHALLPRFHRGFARSKYGFESKSKRSRHVVSQQSRPHH